MGDEDLFTAELEIYLNCRLDFSGDVCTLRQLAIVANIIFPVVRLSVLGI